MSIRLTLFNATARLLVKRAFNTDYRPDRARRRLVKHKLATPTIEVGGVTLERRGSAPATNTILYIPGGGFMLGVDDSHRRFVDAVCAQTGAQGYILHYRLSPEHCFPAAHEDAQNAVAYVAALTSADTFTVIADSAGGALTIPAVQAYSGPKAIRIVLLSPLTDLAMTGRSHVYNRYRDPLFGPEAIIHKSINYLAGANPTDPRASPLWSDLTGLPEALIVVGSTEVLFEDSSRLAARVNACGGRAELLVVQRAPHDFPLLVPKAPESRKVMTTIVNFVLATGK